MDASGFCLRQPRAASGPALRSSPPVHWASRATLVSSGALDSFAFATGPSDEERA